MNNNNLGERIRERLEKKGLTQKELAIKAGITEAAVSHYVKGDRVPRSTVLSRIAIVLDTTPEFLLEGIPNDIKGELGFAKRLIARNAEQMSKEEKMELINILLGGVDEKRT